MKIFLHFLAIIFHSDGPDLDSVLLKQIPHIRLSELDRIVSNVNFMFSPDNDKNQEYSREWEETRLLFGSDLRKHVLKQSLKIFDHDDDVL